MKNNAKKTKKLLPLAVLLAAAALLGILLAVLTRSSTDAADTTIPLCGFTAEEIDRLAYSGNNMDVALLKGSTGDWMLDSDPALPLDQAKVTSLVEQYAALAALRPRHADWAATVIEAKAWLSAALAQADSLEVGHGIGPVHHFHAWW